MQTINILPAVTRQPAPHARLRLVCQSHDRVGAMADGRRKHDLCAANRHGFAIAIRHDRSRPVRRADIDQILPHLMVATTWEIIWRLKNTRPRRSRPAERNQGTAYRLWN